MTSAIHGLPVDETVFPARDVVELLRALVAIDSVNPSLVAGAAGETAAADFIENWASHTGLVTHRLEGSPGRPSVIVESRPTSSGKSLLLCGHADTVGPGQMENAFLPRVDGDRLYGRGGYDMKAGLAAALIACREAARLDLPGRVVVAAVSDEEHSSLGVQEVLGRVSVDAAIVTEPTELVVAVAHRGFVWTEIEVIGVSAHGSRPHLGRDAILKTGPILVALEDLNTALRGRTHPRLGRGFVHGSLIAGGREESTIPDRCLLTIERRTLPGESVEDVERDIAELLARCQTADPELMTRTRTILARPPFRIDERAELVTIVREAAADVLRHPVDVAGVSYWADASLIAAAGIPTLLFGPNGDGAHGDLEWVSLSGTVACAQTLVAVAERFCR